LLSAIFCSKLVDVLVSNICGICDEEIDNEGAKGI
jgi:hypothetical protein